MSLLNIRNLSLSIAGTPILHNVSLDIAAGEIVAVTGESGSGKSMTGRAILRLIRPPGIVEADHINLEGVDLLRSGSLKKDQKVRKFRDFWLLKRSNFLARA